MGQGWGPSSTALICVVCLPQGGQVSEASIWALWSLSGDSWVILDPLDSC